jgi:nucleoside 2-deoxyribosyltransferase
VKVIYLIGSLRNPKVPETGEFLRSAGFEVFDDWYGAGERADDSWQAYERGRGRTYREALDGYASRQIVGFDHTHLLRADAAVLVLPAGRSGHMELGYVMGQGKPGFVLFDGEPERWDQMYGLTFFSKGNVAFSLPELADVISKRQRGL